MTNNVKKIDFKMDFQTDFKIKKYKFLYAFLIQVLKNIKNVLNRNLMTKFWYGTHSIQVGVCGSKPKPSRKYSNSL